MLAVFSVQAEEYSCTLAKGDGTKFGDVTWNEVEWNISADNTSYCQWDGSTSKGYQFGSGSNPCKTLTLSTSGIEGTITKIVVNTSGSNSIAATARVTVGGANFGEGITLTNTATDYTFTGTASGDIVLSYTQTSSKAIYIKSISVTYTTGDSGEGEGEGGGDTPENPEGGETIEGGTATYTASDNYNADTSVDGVEIALGDYVTATFSKASGGTAPKYYAKGTSIRWYSKNTLVIESTAGSITGITFEFGSGEGSNAITANVGTYSSGTWTGSANSVTFTVGGTSGHRRISSISVTYAGKQEGEPVVEDVVMPVISPAETDYNVGETIEVEITTTTENATIYYTIDGTDPNTNSLVYSSPIEVSSTTTIKAYAVKDGCNDSPRAEKTFTFRNIVTLNNCTVAELIEAYASGDDIAKGATVVGYIVGAADGSLSNAEFGTATVDTNILLADDPYETNVENCIPVQLPSGVRTALNLKDNSDNYQKKVILTGDVEAYFSVAGLKNTSAYEFVEMFYNTITVSDAGWATLYLPTTARIPSNVEAYTVTAVNDGWVSLTQVKGVIPANTGIIVKANAGEYELIVSETATTDVTGNLLSGSAYPKNIYDEAYVLGIVDGKVGLYKAEMAGGVWLNNANKAYLPASAVPNKSAAFYGFDWNGTTGIEKVEIGNEKSEIYDLTGRRVETITEPGIYIVNGKKVLVK